MKLLVCGGRDFYDTHLAFGTLNWLHRSKGPVILVVHGAARGADGLAHSWAKSKGIPVAPCPADWAKHGKKAGPIRNQRMLDEFTPDMVVAFPGGTGTADMMRRARRAGVEVFEVDCAAPQD